MGIDWSESAKKHNIKQSDILHAMKHAIHYEKEYEESRIGGRKPSLWIGRPEDESKPLLEIMGIVTPPRDIFIFHAMEARLKFLQRIPTDKGDQNV